MADLISRVEQLEQSLRRARALSIAAVTILGVLILSGSTHPQDGGKTDAAPSPSLRARSLEIVNADNKVVLVLDADAMGTGRLSFRDRKGNESVCLPSKDGAAEKQLAKKGDATKRENWRALKKGMAKDEVSQLLGEAEKVSSNQSFETWYYGYPVGGSVQFTPRGVVEAWNEP